MPATSRAGADILYRMPSEVQHSHPRVLVVTNDFPPTFGGIQTYVRDYLTTLDPNKVVVFASTQHAANAREFDSQQDYTVVRWPRKVMLPTPATVRRICLLYTSDAADDTR